MFYGPESRPQLRFVIVTVVVCCAYFQNRFLVSVQELRGGCVPIFFLNSCFEENVMGITHTVYRVLCGITYLSQ